MRKPKYLHARCDTYHNVKHAEKHGFETWETKHCYLKHANKQKAYFTWYMRNTMNTYFKHVTKYSYLKNVEKHSYLKHTKDIRTWNMPENILIRSMLKRNLYLKYVKKKNILETCDTNYYLKHYKKETLLDTCEH